MTGAARRQGPGRLVLTGILKPVRPPEALRFSALGSSQRYASNDIHHRVAPRGLMHEKKVPCSTRLPYFHRHLASIAAFAVSGSRLPSLVPQLVLPHPPKLGRRCVFLSRAGGLGPRRQARKSLLIWCYFSGKRTMIHEAFAKGDA